MGVGCIMHQMWRHHSRSLNKKEGEVFRKIPVRKVVAASPYASKLWAPKDRHGRALVKSLSQHKLHVTVSLTVKTKRMWCCHGIANLALILAVSIYRWASHAQRQTCIACHAPALCHTCTELCAHSAIHLAVRNETLHLLMSVSTPSSPLLFPPVFLLNSLSPGGWEPVVGSP